MTTEISKVFKDNKYPPFIKNHTIFKQVKTVQKIFPLIGLSNCEEKIEIDNTAEVKQLASALLGDIAYYLTHRASDRWYADHPMRDLVTAFAVACVGPETIKDNGSKTTLHIATNITCNGKVVFKAGEGLFKAYNKLIKLVETETVIAPVESISVYFKLFSSANVPTTGCKMVFSSDGSDGLWDIATMSMRGISSCQSWTSENSKHLVGSMIDPFTGILYITSGSKFGEVGSKMMRRCIVRFVVDAQGKEQSLLMERMYPSYDANIAAVFKEFLSRKTKNKFQIIDNGLNSNSVTIAYNAPSSKSIRALPPDNRPYCDSAIQYITDKNDVVGLTKEKVNAFLGAMPSRTAITILAQFKLLEEKLTPKQQATLDMLCGRSTNISYAVYACIETALCSRTGELWLNDDFSFAKKDIADLLDKCLSKITKGAISYSMRNTANVKPTKSNSIPDEIISGICKRVSKQVVKEFATECLQGLKRKSSKNAPLYLSLLAA